MSAGRVPPIFISHGTPALAVDTERGRDLTQWGTELGKPRAVLVVSAHWKEPSLSRGSTAAHPALLHDFDGSPAHSLPDSLRSVTYPAPGAPDLAYDVHSLLSVERAAERGWDHGVWSPLVHLFPGADVPVLQLSLVRGARPRALFAIGRKLGVLAARGVLLVGSGGITSGLEGFDPNPDAVPAEWAREFDGWVANCLADAELDDLLDWRAKGPHARRAHPTPDPLEPLFVIAGAASLYDHAVGFPLRGFEHGTLSRRCVQFGR